MMLLKCKTMFFNFNNERKVIKKFNTDILILIILVIKMHLLAPVQIQQPKGENIISILLYTYVITINQSLWAYY